MNTWQYKEDRVIELLKKGEKSPDALMIGMELEHFVVDKASGQSVSYEQDKGIEVILSQMKDEAHQPIWEKNHLIGLSHPDYQITLEPGGQIEISIRPCEQLEEMASIYRNFLDKIIPITESQDQWLLCIGYHPKSSIHDIPFNPKERYVFMSEYLKNHGRYAHNMMKGTASLQVVVDYCNEEDFIKKFRVAHFLMPVLALLTDNAPYFEGAEVTHHSMRTAIWDETDPARSGLIPGVMDKSFGYREYARYILNVCPIMTKKDNRFIDAENKKAGELENFDLLSDEEVDHLLSMVFPDVRLRQYMEIRMADSIPFPYNLAFAALIKGLFYQQEALDYLYRLSRDVTDQKLLNYRKQIMKKGYAVKIERHTCGEIMRILFDLAKRTLNKEERDWLSKLEALVEEEKTLADISLQRAKKEEDWMKYLAANRGFGEEKK